MNVISIDDRLKLIDLYDMSKTMRTGAYVILEEKITIIETSASPSVVHLKAGLATLGISLTEVDYIILTHIHLDHAGGAGLFLQDCPNAKIVVHPKAARHLIDPSRLEAGSRAVFGKDFDRLYHPLIPVPEDRVIIKADKEQLQISSGVTLTFYDTPGHANHHFSIYDPVSKGMFCGDAAGLTYPELIQDGVSFFLPTTSPNQFNPDAMRETLQSFEKMDLDYLYFGHFGATNQVDKCLTDVARWIDIFVSAGKEAYLKETDIEVQISHTSEILMAEIKRSLTALGVADDHTVYKIIRLDLRISAMGLLDYWQKKLGK